MEQITFIQFTPACLPAGRDSRFRGNDKKERGFSPSLTLPRSFLTGEGTMQTRAPSPARRIGEVGEG